MKEHLRTDIFITLGNRRIVIRFIGRIFAYIMSQDRAIMKREITINTLVVCGLAARPPSLARFILPRWGKSFVCSTLPSSCPDRTYTVPQEFPHPFIRDSFVRYRELPYLRCLPTLRFIPSVPAFHPSQSSISSMAAAR